MNGKTKVAVIDMCNWLSWSWDGVLFDEGVIGSFADSYMHKLRPEQITDNLVIPLSKNNTLTITAPSYDSNNVFSCLFSWIMESMACSG